jgi:hypothetical protein
MAIKNLTGRGARLPEIGKLFKGAKKEKKVSQNGREYETFGRELDYWRFESKDPLIMEAFNEAFTAKLQPDEKLREIPVYLPFPLASQNFEAWQEAYTAGGLSHRCDGETCVLWLDEKTQTYQSTPKPCPTLKMAPEKAKRDGCKAVGRLQVVIPALNQLGFVTVETHSKNDILHLDAALQAYESLRSEGLRGIPMLLRRVQKSISTPGDGKRARRDKWMIELKPHPEWAALYLDSQRQQALAAVASPLLLTTNLTEDDDDDDTQADIEREQILAAMGDIYIGKGKTEIEWASYKAGLDAKSTDDLKAILGKWRALGHGKALAAAAAVQSAPEPIHDGEVYDAEPVEQSPVSAHAEIEQAIATLQAAGCNPDHINNKIAKITGGVYAVDEIDEKDLAKVRMMLGKYLEMGNPAEAMAKEGKK